LLDHFSQLGLLSRLALVSLQVGRLFGLVRPHERLAFIEDQVPDNTVGSLARLVAVGGVASRLLLRRLVYDVIVLNGLRDNILEVISKKNVVLVFKSFLKLLLLVNSTIDN